MMIISRGYEIISLREYLAGYLDIHDDDQKLFINRMQFLRCIIYTHMEKKRLRK